MTDLPSSMNLYLVTDDKGRPPQEIADIVARGIDGGATAVQFREKNCGPTLCARAFSAVSRVCSQNEIPLYVNADLLGRFEIDAPFTGVQYSDRTLPLNAAKLHLAGYSAHGVDDAVKAFTHNISFCTISPIYPTPSKAGILDPVGVDTIQRLRVKLPDAIIVALGGIDETNAAHCMEAGASGVAVIRAIMASDDPERAARRLRAIVENFNPA